MRLTWCFTQNQKRKICDHYL